MHRLRLGIGLVFVTAAFGNAIGTTDLVYTIVNDTGVVVNGLDLFAPAGDGATIMPSAPFTGSPSPFHHFEISGPNVLNGSSVAFSLEASGDNFFDDPVILAYDWTFNGSPVVFPVGNFPIGAGVTFGDQQSLVFHNGSAVHGDDYTDLYVRQNGISVLTVGTSGTVGPSELLSITNPMDMSAGLLEFGYTDTTSGATVAGTFTPITIPEPASSGLCALGLSVAALAARRRGNHGRASGPRLSA